MEKLKAELDHLWRVERPDTTQKVSWAASLGDRSENADYHYNKKRLREIDRRLLYLRKRIDDLKVVNYSPFQEGKVLFGAWVEIEITKAYKNVSASSATMRSLIRRITSLWTRQWHSR